MSQPHRLGSSLPPEFSAPLIERARPLRFTVDGRRIEGFEGDTVLSALLANGVVAAGVQRGHGIALDAHSAPPVTMGDRPAPMPMALCPAIAGAQYRTVGPRRPTAPLQRFFPRRPESLGHDFDAPRAPGGWIDAPPDETLDTDILVIGGGVAGMAAALEAARGGSRVILIEREPVLGGMAVFFGKTDGETPPEEVTAQLAAQIAAQTSITVLTRTEAFDMADGGVRAVEVQVSDGLAQPRHLAIAASGTVLATGMDERLPIFPGNRLPGVLGAGFAWRMARQFAVWPGRSFHLHTATNAGYRLAMLGADSGRSVLRATDPRPDPRTRFIDFCKAYGFRLGWDTGIASVVAERGRLAIRPAGHRFGEMQDERVEADTLIVSGGWQPAIALWLLAGGETAWDEAGGRFVAQGRIDGTVLAGAATGIAGTNGCIESGRAAIGELGDGQRRVIADPRIDEAYESREGPFTVSAPQSRLLPAAWTSPARRAALPEPAARGITAFFAARHKRDETDIRAAGLADIAGAVASGALDAAEVPHYCRQWLIVPRIWTVQDLPADPPSTPTGLPPYLAGRFGPSEAQWSLAAEAGRTFEPGCLIFINTDETHPANAIGVVVAASDGHCVALMARTEFGEGDVVYIRDGTACSPARLRGKL